MGSSFGQKRKQSKVNFNVGYLFPESDEDFGRLKTSLCVSLDRSSLCLVLKAYSLSTPEPFQGVFIRNIEPATSTTTGFTEQISDCRSRHPPHFMTCILKAVQKTTGERERVLLLLSE